MRQRNSYSRLVQDLKKWDDLEKGQKIKLFHHCVEKGVTTFLTNTPEELHPRNSNLGTALSESGLSRDEIRLVGEIHLPGQGLMKEVNDLIESLRTDYLDLVLVDLRTVSDSFVDELEQLRNQGKVMEIGVLVPEKSFSLPLIKKISPAVVFFPLDPTPANIKVLLLESREGNHPAEFLYLNSNLPVSGPEYMQERYGLNKKQVLLSWLLQHPSKFHLVLQAQDAVHIDEAVKALHTQWIDQDWRRFPQEIDEL